MEPPILTPSNFVAVVNQTFEYALPRVVIAGELANFRVSKNRWVYFDLKDDSASVKFFGTVYNLPGPLEEGMTLEVTASPKLSPQYGFSLTVQSIRLSGEGTIKKAQDLLFKQLEDEGLFAPERKRLLPYPPEHIGLITSAESAAYADFTKILGQRHGGLDIRLADVQVQGAPAPGQITRAIEWFNAQAELVQVLVIVRGGGSADDLQAFSDEQVVRAVAASRIPTLVAIGHEVDLSLAELAADVRASTPSNAAELLVPDKKEEQARLKNTKQVLENGVQNVFISANKNLLEKAGALHRDVGRSLDACLARTALDSRTLAAFNPRAALKRGYVLVRDENGRVVRSKRSLKTGNILSLEFSDGKSRVEVQ